MFVCGVVVFWLIQSQAQGGACSAPLHQRNTYGGIDIVIVQVRFQLGDGQICYLKHPHDLLEKVHKKYPAPVGSKAKYNFTDFVNLRKIPE